METPPCTWTKPPCRLHRHRHRSDESRDDNGGEAIPTPRSQAAATTEAAGITIPELPEDVLQHIHSLMTMRDAARAASVSRAFLRFWRHYPNLTFNQETLAASRQPFLQSNKDRGRYVFTKTRQVLKNHSGAGVKTLKLNLSTCSKDDIDAVLLDGWLRSFIAGGGGAIADLALQLPNCFASEYTFPYSLLLLTDNDDAAGTDDHSRRISLSTSSIQSLHLASCGFHPTVTVGGALACSRSLSRVRLSSVGVTGDELWAFLSSCFALEQLDLSGCDMIEALRIPRALVKLKVVWVRVCRAMAAVESDAPNLSTFSYEGRRLLSRFTLGDLLETKELDLHATRMIGLIQYAGSYLPSVAPNLERLVLSTDHERLKAPVMTDRFKNLKHLVICLGESGEFCAGYDFLSLTCFLDACVALETFILRIADGFGWYKKYHIVGEPDENPWQSSRQEIPGIRYGGLGNLKKATITGFCTAKSLVELTWHILEKSSSSLQCLVLDASPGYDRKHSTSDRCLPMRTEALRDAEKALIGVREHVEPRVPVGVEHKVLGPCSRCHAMDAEGVAEEAGSKTPRRFWQRQEDGHVALVYVLPRS